MKNPDRIVIERHVSAKWRLPPIGWVVVFTLALLMIGAMFYVVRNMLDNANRVL